MTATTNVSVTISIDGYEYESEAVGEYDDDDCALARNAVLSRFDDIVEPVYHVNQKEREIYEGVCEIVRTEKTYVRWRRYVNTDPSEETDDYDPSWECQHIDTRVQPFSN